MKHTRILAIALAILVTGCATTPTLVVDVRTPEPTPVPPMPTSAPAPVRVYLTGCVQEPGVYELAAHSIVDDFLTAAGGPTHDAWLDAINLAREPQHEEHVTIPCLSMPVLSGVEGPGPVVTQAATPGMDSVTTPGPSAACQPDQVRINTANAVELESLPGIGPALAQRIMAYIAANGPFQSVEELENVEGIGPASLDKLRPHVCVE